MKYEISKEDKYTVLTLEEEKLDTLVAPNLKSEIVTLFQTGTVNLILNLAHVKYVDSSGLSSILVANRISGENNGVLVLANVSDHVMKLITISRLESVLNIFSNLNEAVDAVLAHVNGN